MDAIYRPGAFLTLLVVAFVPIFVAVELDRVRVAGCVHPRPARFRWYGCTTSRRQYVLDARR